MDEEFQTYSSIMCQSTIHPAFMSVSPSSHLHSHHSPLPKIHSQFPLISFSSPPRLSLLPSHSLTSLQMSSSSSPPHQIHIIRNVSPSFISSKNITSWPTWSSPASTFPWEYSQTEECYILSGKVTVIPDDTQSSYTFGTGDFVTLSKNLKCTWIVHEDVSKHYNFTD